MNAQATPVGVILSPTRELAIQTGKEIQCLLKHLKREVPHRGILMLAWIATQ